MAPGKGQINVRAAIRASLPVGTLFLRIFHKIKENACAIQAGGNSMRSPFRARGRVFGFLIIF